MYQYLVTDARTTVSSSDKRQGLVSTARERFSSVARVTTRIHLGHAIITLFLLTTGDRPPEPRFHLPRERGEDKGRVAVHGERGQHGLTRSIEGGSKENKRITGSTQLETNLILILWRTTQHTSRFCPRPCVAMTVLASCARTPPAKPHGLLHSSRPSSFSPGGVRAHASETPFLHRKASVFWGIALASCIQGTTHGTSTSLFIFVEDDTAEESGSGIACSDFNPLRWHLG